MASFRYSLGKMGSGYCPILPIQLYNPDTKKHALIMSLVDTGASACLMPANVALTAGCKLEDGEKSKTRGIMGIEMICYKHPFIIKIVSPQMNKVIWESKKAILIDCADHDRTPALLGYNEFLRNFNISVNYKGGHMILNI